MSEAKSVCRYDWVSEMHSVSGGYEFIRWVTAQGVRFELHRTGFFDGYTLKIYGRNWMLPSRLTSRLVEDGKRSGSTLVVYVKTPRALVNEVIDQLSGISWKETLRNVYDS